MNFSTLRFSPFLAISGIFWFLPFSVIAEQELRIIETEVVSIDEGEAGVDLQVTFVSNYLDRGEDVFASRAAQEKESYGSSTGAWAVQPSVTFQTPVKGLSFDLWMSFATEGRENQDVDQVYQRSPGGPDVLGSYNYNPLDMYTAEYAGWTPYTFLDFEECESNDSCVPGLYKEENGLRVQDRMILTLDYGFESKLGNVNFGITSDSYINSVNKDSATTEIFVVYAHPFLPQVSLESFMDISNSDNYFFLSYSDEHEFEVGLPLAVDYILGAGYNITDKMHGVRDVTGEVNVGAMGFFVGIIATYRPNLAFFDEDETSWPGAPLWMVGRSTRTDGLVADPSRQYGLLNTYINSEIESYLINSTGYLDYEYTARQKLPRTLWALRLGYAISL